MTKKRSGGFPPYAHSERRPGFKHNNRTRFFQLCKVTLGADYTKWSDHPNRPEVEELAHIVIYGKTYSYQSYRNSIGNPKETALRLQINFLLQAPSQLRKTTHASYEQAIASAIDAGVVTADQVLAWR
jgi:hypothetical protein